MTVSMDKKYVTRDGLYNAKVIYIHDKGDQPVVVFAEYKKDAMSNTTFRVLLNGRVWQDAENGFDLIEVPEETQDGWIKFDAENDKVPFLHMHDIIEVKYDNGLQSFPIHAFSVHFYALLKPVVAYRLVEKAEQPKEKSSPRIEVFVDVAEAAENEVFNANHGLERRQVANAAREAAVRAVLKQAGVKV